MYTRESITSTIMTRFRRNWTVDDIVRTAIYAWLGLAVLLCFVSPDGAAFFFGVSLSSAVLLYLAAISRTIAALLVFVVFNSTCLMMSSDGSGASEKITAVLLLGAVDSAVSYIYALRIQDIVASSVSGLGVDFSRCMDKLLHGRIRSPPQVTFLASLLFGLAVLIPGAIPIFIIDVLYPAPEHCHGHLQLDEVPVALHPYLEGKEQLRDEFRATQHGTVLHTSEGKLYFSATDPEHESRNILHEATTSSVNPGKLVFRQHPDIFEPRMMTTIDEARSIFCFIYETNYGALRVVCGKEGDTNFTKTNWLEQLYQTNLRNEEVFGAGGLLWISKKPDFLISVDPISLEVVSYSTENMDKGAHVRACFLKTPAFLMLLVSTPIITTVASAYLLLAKGVPSGMATLFIGLSTAGISLFKNDGIVYVFAVVAIVLIMVLRFFVGPSHPRREALMWLLYGGVFPGMLIMFESSLWTVAAALLTGLALEHALVTLFGALIGILTELDGSPRLTLLMKCFCVVAVAKVLYDRWLGHEQLGYAMQRRRRDSDEVEEDTNALLEREGMELA